MITNPKSKFLILQGDYNLPGIKWKSVNNNIVSKLSNKSSLESSVLANCS